MKVSATYMFSTSRFVGRFRCVYGTGTVARLRGVWGTEAAHDGLVKVLIDGEESALSTLARNAKLFEVGSVSVDGREETRYGGGFGAQDGLAARGAGGAGGGGFKVGGGGWGGWAGGVVEWERGGGGPRVLPDQGQRDPHGPHRNRRGPV